MCILIISSYIGTSSGDGRATGQLRQRISLAIQKGNTASLLSMWTLIGIIYYVNNLSNVYFFKKAIHLHQVNYTQFFLKDPKSAKTLISSSRSCEHWISKYMILDR